MPLFYTSHDDMVKGAGSIQTGFLGWIAPVLTGHPEDRK
jgi:hypothetical protein